MTVVKVNDSLTKYKHKTYVGILQILNKIAFLNTVVFQY